MDFSSSQHKLHRRSNYFTDEHLHDGRHEPLTTEVVLQHRTLFGREIARNLLMQHDRFSPWSGEKPGLINGEFRTLTPLI
jgi:hypothetical protein